MTKRGRKPNTFGRPDWALRLTQARISAGYANQEEFAPKVGKSQSSYAAYETGETEPNLATWRRIGEVLNLSPAWLAFGTGTREPGEGDTAVWASIETHHDNKGLMEAIHQVTKMLSDEQVGSNAAFAVRLSIKIVQEAQGIEDQLEARETIRRAVERERAELRQGLDQLRASRL